MSRVTSHAYTKLPLAFSMSFKFTFSVLDCHTTKGERLVKWKRFGEFFKE